MKTLRSGKFWGLLAWLLILAVSVWGIGEAAYYLHIGKTIPQVAIAFVIACCVLTLMVGMDVAKALKKDQGEKPHA